MTPNVLARYFVRTQVYDLLTCEDDESITIRWAGVLSLKARLIEYGGVCFVEIRSILKGCQTMKRVYILTNIPKWVFFSQTSLNSYFR